MTAPELTALSKDDQLRAVTSAVLAIAALATVSGCKKAGSIERGGIYVTRSTCPQLGIPAATGDITLFSPAGRTDSAAIDVVATITNLRGNCSEDATYVNSTATFDVVATRRDVAQARQVTLPYYQVIAQGGSTIVAKKIGYVALNFAAGSMRAQTNAQVVGRVARGAVVLPADIERELTRVRRPGDADAAVDPMTDPRIRDAVAKATFEQLIGFQLTQDQLRYNATR